MTEFTPGPWTATPNLNDGPHGPNYTVRAAAPDLLAALETVFDKHAKPCFQGDPNTMEPEWEAARAAIAKARGQE